MSRYVDAEWLIKESMSLSFSVQKWVNEVQIMTAPSIDVTFCKECRHRIHTPAAPNKNCPCEIHPELNNCGLRKGLKPIVKLDDFCSYGERREP